MEAREPTLQRSKSFACCTLAVPADGWYIGIFCPEALSELLLQKKALQSAQAGNRCVRSEQLSDEMPRVYDSQRQRALFALRRVARGDLRLCGDEFRTGSFDALEFVRLDKSPSVDKLKTANDRVASELGDVVAFGGQSKNKKMMGPVRGG